MITAERQSLLNSDISTSETRPRLMAALARASSEFGFDYVSILTAPGPNAVLLAPLVQESTLPGAFLKQFDQKLFLRDCPIVPRMSDSILPQTWRINPHGPSLDFDCPEELHELLLQYELISGVIFPVNSVDSTRFLIRYDGRARSLSQVEINELGMISIHAFDVFDRIRRSEAASLNVLSAREMEVLRWTSQGKTSIEIGQILSLSDHTINAYMTNAIKKLDCVNRTQLVAKAIRLKLIS